MSTSPPLRAATVGVELSALYQRYMSRASGVLWDCFRYHYHKDKSNAATHCAPVRFSPLTYELAQVLQDNYVLQYHSPEHREAVQEVLTKSAEQQ